jgi:hypothetical protein
MPWTKKQHRYFGYRCGQGDKEFCKMNKESVGRTCASCEIGYHARCRDADCDCCGGNPRRGPRMTEVFRIKEAPIGSKPFQRTQFTRMGQPGQNLGKEIDQKSKAGTPYNVWQTKDNQIMATPSQQTGGQPVLKANPIDGTWDPMDDKQQKQQQQAATKTGPQPAQTNNLMKGGGGTM